MSVTIRVAVALEPGCKLYYDCPLKGGSFQAEQFFEKYHGKYATFVSYSEELVDVLDSRGRLPGRYINLEGINVRFDGEEEVQNLNIVHFVVADASKAQLMDNSAKDQRLGDLPHPLLFYPGDMVRFTKKPDREGVTDDLREIQSIFLGKPFTSGDTPRYHVMETAAEAKERIRKFDERNETRPEGQRLVRSWLQQRDGWNTAGDDIKLIARGNVWALYNDSSQLAFSSDGEYVAFWAKDGICKYVPDDVAAAALGIPKHALRNTFGLALEHAYRLFVLQEADVITLTHSNPGDGPRYTAKRIHDCFAEHREHVRALTERLWAHQVKQSAA